MLINARDECNGLYFLIKGELEISVLQLDQTFAKKKQNVYEGTLVGEISFFLNTKRTATVVNVTNNRVCFLSCRVKKLFQIVCPRLARYMHQ